MSHVHSTHSTCSNSSLQLAVTSIRNALVDCEVSHVLEATPENPCIFMCGTVVDGYLNRGYIYGETDGTVSFFAHDQAAENRAKQEDIADGAIKSWWIPKNTDDMLAFLMGEVRDVQHRVYRSGPVE